MSTTKVPIYLKRGSRRGKKEKLRDILSSDMISPPLGDFRHTIHIGNGGENDMFGDISFLQGKFHLLPRSESQLDAPGDGHYVVPFEFSRTSTISGYEAPSLDVPSPLLKNAISLPVIGGLQALTLPSAQAPPKPPRLHLDDRAAAQATDPVRELAPGSRTLEPLGAPNGKCAAPLNGFAKEENQDGAFLSHAGSLLSLHVDLGPSILDDVLQVMEKHQTGDEAAPLQDSSRRQLLT
ncbi:Cdc42 effector protein 2 [Varanus komodoensis]|uniref:CDC42 effector protein 2 n=2 Tax=Varanus komodoensis TaxID=61221 RepID=A0A8D2JBH7_VARKO|nr:cdc42 effector protein 2 isoform X2 [Varanus komodoensis]XP_044304516.1 cdc42 effector protein 2 isoform X2 [Varanus komodoensis]KAF7238619.1 Cdc42 effector protein 2 [Varanus komodoensis]